MLSSDAVDTLKRTRSQVTELQVAAGRLASQAELLASQREAALARSHEALAEADLTLKARLLLETYSEDEQEALRRRVEGLVGRGLSVIFGEDYGFRVEVGLSRGQASMAFKVTSPDGERDPLQSHGGGVVNVVSFVLRVVVAALTPGLSRCLILDEPFAQLSAEYLEPMGAFLRELVDATGLQLIIISHEPEVAAVADYSYRLSRRGGVTVVS